MSFFRLICQLFPIHYGQSKNWVDRHPHAKIIKHEHLPNGHRIEAEDGGEHMVIITDALGNVVVEQP